MKTFKAFYVEHYHVLSEEIHSQLQEILDSPDSGNSRTLYDSTARKLHNFTKVARKLIKNGEDTGLDGDKPKKGSSRAVFFPKDHKDITLDGKPAKIKTAVKIAFPGKLDKYKVGDERLLGEHQNEIEGDGYTRNKWGILYQHDPHDETSFKTNHESGVLAPVLSSHRDHHYLEMGHVSPMKKSDFQRLTVCKSHPKGIKFDDMYNTLNKEHSDAHGIEGHYIPRSHTDSVHDNVMQHPFVQNLHEMMLETGMHPGDLRPTNMGIWTHPHTNKQYPVVSDYGYSDDISKHYWKRRQRLYESQRRY